MLLPPRGHVDTPADRLVVAGISCWATTDADGSPLGVTLVCGRLAAEPNYDGLPVKILTGPAAGQVKEIQVHAGNTLIVGDAFTNPAGAVQQITVGTLFVILSAATTSSVSIATILALTSAMLTLDESNGVLLSTAGEQNVYANFAPAGSFKPIVVKIDLDLMVGGDTTIIRLREMIRPGVWVLTDYEAYVGADGGLLDGITCIYVTMQPNRYGVRVTLQQTVGGFHNYQWEVLVDD